MIIFVLFLHGYFHIWPFDKTERSSKIESQKILIWHQNMFSRIVWNSPNDGRGLSDGTFEGDSTDNEVEEGGGEGNLESIYYFVFFIAFEEYKYKY